MADETRMHIAQGKDAELTGHGKPACLAGPCSKENSLDCEFCLNRKDCELSLCPHGLPRGHCANCTECD